MSNCKTCRYAHADKCLFHAPSYDRSLPHNIEYYVPGRGCGGWTEKPTDPTDFTIPATTPVKAVTAELDPRHAYKCCGSFLARVDRTYRCHVCGLVIHQGPTEPQEVVKERILLEHHPSYLESVLNYYKPHLKDVVSLGLTCCNQPVDCRLVPASINERRSGSVYYVCVEFTCRKCDRLLVILIDPELSPYAFVQYVVAKWATLTSTSYAYPMLTVDTDGCPDMGGSAMAQHDRKILQIGINKALWAYHNKGYAPVSVDMTWDS